MDEEITIRNIRETDIPVLLEMTSAEGWKYSEVDCRAGLVVDSNGITVAEDTLGCPIGFIGHCNMVGMVLITVFITREDKRGRGIGRCLWKEMLKKSSGKVIVLDGVMDMVPWYKSQGFVFEEFRREIYSGTVTRTAEIKSVDEPNCTIQTLSDELWPQLLEYDRQIYKIRRDQVLQAWFDSKWSVTLVAMNAGQLVGYTNFHRKCDSKYNIRALCADSLDIVEKLLDSVLNMIPEGANVSLALMEGKQLPKIVEDFRHEYSLQRLLTKQVEPPNTEKIYFTQEMFI